MRASARVASSSSRGSKVCDDELGLGLGEGAVGEEAADAGQPLAQGPGQAGEVPGRDRPHREGAGDLVDEVVVPPVGQVEAAARSAARPRASSRVMARSAPSVPAAAHDSIAAHCRAIPTSAAGLRARRRAPAGPAAVSSAAASARRRRGGVPGAAVLERGRAARAGPRPGRGASPGPGVVVCLPSHEPAPFDHQLRPKLIVEHYDDPLTFQPARRARRRKISDDLRWAVWSSANSRSKIIQTMFVAIKPRFRLSSA